MTLGKREKILAGAVGAMVVVLVAQIVWSQLGGPGAGELRRQRNELKTKIDGYKKTVEAAADAVARLDRWEAASLPRKLDAARSCYQAWLRGLVEKFGFRGCEVFSGEPQARRDAYTVFPFQIQGEASLDELVRFLHEFYSTGHLHKVRRLSIRPIGDGSRLQLAIAIEALSLPNADRLDTLSEAKADRLRLGQLDAYRRLVNRRLMESERWVETGGLFAAWRPAPKPPDPPWVDRRVEPPRQPPPPPPPPFDHGRFAVVTGILEVDGRPQLWLLVQTTGQRQQLGQGDEFRVGLRRGKVVWIGSREAEIELDGKRRLVSVGQRLDEGIETPD